MGRGEGSRHLWQPTGSRGGRTDRRVVVISGSLQVVGVAELIDESL